MRSRNHLRVFVLLTALAGAILLCSTPRSGFADRLANGDKQKTPLGEAMCGELPIASNSLIRTLIGNWPPGRIGRPLVGSRLFGDLIPESKATPSTAFSLLRPTSSKAGPAPSATVDVSVGPNELIFEPETVTINVGDTVRWTWQTSGHTVTSGSTCGNPDNKFCSPGNSDCANPVPSSAGAVYTRTFNQAGNFPYYCGPHCSQGMQGLVIVQALTATTLQLSQSSYTVNESSDFATINVTRTGDTSGAATVKYTTSDATDVNFNCNPSTGGQPTGQASRKCDYHIAVGRLRFAPGESSKQINLSIVNDVYVEPSESLTITLSDATGAPLGTPNTATINITDNDSGSAANPIDGTPFYVRMLYVDLLSREPDPSGFAGWVHRIDFCGQPGEPPPPCDRVTVGGDGFLRSAEFFDREFFVLRLYRAGLGRILTFNDVGDLAYVSGFITTSDLELNKQDLVAEIMSRPEFSNSYNGLSNSAFVDKLIQTAAVTIPQSVRDGWVNALNGSRTRAQVYRELSERQEVSDRYLHEAQVVSCYYGFFTRNPDGAYLNYLDRLDRGEINLGDLANAFINAAEYRLRFGP
jgi:plastocyanin